MKRCPECKRDYVDDTLLYCLEDGSALVQGAVPLPDEPLTALLHDTARPGEPRHGHSFNGVPEWPLNVDPAWDPLRADPRFIDLTRRVGLPQRTTP